LSTLFVGVLEGVSGFSVGTEFVGAVGSVGIVGSVTVSVGIVTGVVGLVKVLVGLVTGLVGLVTGEVGSVGVTTKSSQSALEDAK
jgi:hypothetical protein